jgi:hypothetical protein
MVEGHDKGSCEILFTFESTQDLSQLMLVMEVLQGSNKNLFATEFQQPPRIFMGEQI